MKLLKRLKRLWTLSKKDPDVLDTLTQQQVDSIPDAYQKAAFFGDLTDEEMREMEREDKGYKNLFGIGL